MNCTHASVVNILKVIKGTIKYHEFQSISISVTHILHINAILWFWAGLPYCKWYLRFAEHGLLHQEVFKQEQHIDILDQGRWWGADCSRVVWVSHSSSCPFCVREKCPLAHWRKTEQGLGNYEPRPRVLLNNSKVEFNWFRVHSVAVVLAC